MTKFFLTAASAITLTAAPAHAQLLGNVGGAVNGAVNGTLGGSLNGVGNVGSALNGVGSAAGSLNGTLSGVGSVANSVSAIGREPPMARRAARSTAGTALPAAMSDSRAQ